MKKETKQELIMYLKVQYNFNLKINIMELNLRNYHDEFIELNNNEIYVRITTKKEALKLINNLEEITDELKDFVNCTKNK